MSTTHAILWSIYAVGFALALVTARKDERLDHTLIGLFWPVLVAMWPIVKFDGWIKTTIQRRDIERQRQHLRMLVDLQTVVPTKKVRRRKQKICIPVPNRRV